MSFVLDQAAFDAQMGANTFDLAQYFAVQRSPNLVPEPEVTLLGLSALCALTGLASGSRRGLREAADAGAANLLA